MAGSWSQAGGIARYGYGGMFWKAIPKDQWPEEEDYLTEIEQQWQEPFGDMRQELVFIGQNLDEQQIRQQLDNCLLNDTDLMAGQSNWHTMADPFPEWQ